MEAQQGSWYEIEPRPAALGDGWRLHLYERDPETGEIVEAGGGMLPVVAHLSEIADSQEKASQAAYADAMESGEEWLCTRTVQATEVE